LLGKQKNGCQDKNIILPVENTYIGYCYYSHCNCFVSLWFLWRILTKITDKSNKKLNNVFNNVFLKFVVSKINYTQTNTKILSFEIQRMYMRKTCFLIIVKEMNPRNLYIYVTEIHRLRCILAFEHPYQ